MERPNIVKQVPPIYPRELMGQRVEATLLVKCVITEDGSLTNCRILKGVPYLNEAVLAAVEKWKYTPVVFEGHPVRVDYTITIHVRPPDLPQRPRYPLYPGSP
jgi:protein TonB